MDAERVLNGCLLLASSIVTLLFFLYLLKEIYIFGERSKILCKDNTFLSNIQIFAHKNEIFLYIPIFCCNFAPQNWNYEQKDHTYCRIECNDDAGGAETEPEVSDVY